MYTLLSVARCTHPPLTSNCRAFVVLSWYVDCYFFHVSNFKLFTGYKIKLGYKFSSSFGKELLLRNNQLGKSNPQSERESDTHTLTSSMSAGQKRILHPVFLRSDHQHDVLPVANDRTSTAPINNTKDSIVLKILAWEAPQNMIWEKEQSWSAIKTSPFGFVSINWRRQISIILAWNRLIHFFSPDQLLRSGGTLGVEFAVDFLQVCRADPQQPSVSEQRQVLVVERHSHLNDRIRFAADLWKLKRTQKEMPMVQSSVLSILSTQKHQKKTDVLTTLNRASAPPKKSCQRTGFSVCQGLREKWDRDTDLFLILSTLVQQEQVAFLRHQSSSLSVLVDNAPAAGRGIQSCSQKTTRIRNKVQRALLFWDANCGRCQRTACQHWIETQTCLGTGKRVNSSKPKSKSSLGLKRALCKVFSESSIAKITRTFWPKFLHQK